MQLQVNRQDGAVYVSDGAHSVHVGIERMAGR
jgi:hypothetical protein